MFAVVQSLQSMLAAIHFLSAATKGPLICFLTASPSQARQRSDWVHSLGSILACITVSTSEQVIGWHSSATETAMTLLVQNSGAKSLEITSAH